MKIGNKDVINAKWGNKQIIKVYSGNNLVWERDIIIYNSFSTAFSNDFKVFKE